MKEKITEEMGVHKEWYTKAKEQTVESLPRFSKHLTEDYEHDYGTICHAVAAMAIAGASAINHSPEGGITGFQARAVMWEFIQHWMYESNQLGLKLTDYDKLLYPQYEEHFEKKISETTWKCLQEEALKLMNEKREYPVHENVLAHWKSIADGNIPFGFTVDSNSTK